MNDADSATISEGKRSARRKMTAEDHMKVYLDGKPSSKNRSAYTRWWRAAKHLNVNTSPRGLKNDLKKYNREYMRGYRAKKKQSLTLKKKEGGQIHDV